MSEHEPPAWPPPLPRRPAPPEASAPLPPADPPPEPVSRGKNGYAIASLVLGILWIYWIGSILALVFGYIGKRQIDRGGRRQGGRGLAIAGIVLGWIGIGFLILTILVIGVGGA